MSTVATAAQSLERAHFERNLGICLICAMSTRLKIELLDFQIVQEVVLLKLLSLTLISWRKICHSIIK